MVFLDGKWKMYDWDKLILLPTSVQTGQPYHHQHHISGQVRIQAGHPPNRLNQLLCARFDDVLMCKMIHFHFSFNLHFVVRRKPYDLNRKELCVTRITD